MPDNVETVPTDLPARAPAGRRWLALTVSAVAALALVAAVTAFVVIRTTPHTPASSVSRALATETPRSADPTSTAAPSPTVLPASTTAPPSTTPGNRSGGGQASQPTPSAEGCAFSVHLVGPLPQPPVRPFEQSYFDAAYEPKGTCAPVTVRFFWATYEIDSDHTAHLFASQAYHLGPDNLTARAYVVYPPQDGHCHGIYIVHGEQPVKSTIPRSLIDYVGSEPPVAYPGPSGTVASIVAADLKPDVVCTPLTP